MLMHFSIQNRLSRPSQRGLQQQLQLAAQHKCSVLGAAGAPPLQQL